MAHPEGYAIFYSCNFDFSVPRLRRKPHDGVSTLHRATKAEVHEHYCRRVRSRQKCFLVHGVNETDKAVQINSRVARDLATIEDAHCIEMLNCVQAVRLRGY